MGSDEQLKPSSFGSHLRRTSENVPIHGEPNLEGFFFGSDCLMVVNAQADARFD